MQNVELSVLGHFGRHRAERAVSVQLARDGDDADAETLPPKRPCGLRERPCSYEETSIARTLVSRRRRMRRAAIARRDDSRANGTRAPAAGARRSSASSTSRTARSCASGRRRKSTELRAATLLEPLAPFKDQLTIVSGSRTSTLSVRLTRHTRHWLSGVSPRISHDPYGGVTADQIAAQHIGQDTPCRRSKSRARKPSAAAPAMQLRCSYGATISFRTPSTPLPMEFNRAIVSTAVRQGDTPRERMVLAAQYRASRRRRDRRRRCRSSSAPATDEAERYLESVREIERRVRRWS